LAPSVAIVAAKINALRGRFPGAETGKTIVETGNEISGTGNEIDGTGKSREMPKHQPSPVPQNNTIIGVS
jgi:hypothetical protein